MGSDDVAILVMLAAAAYQAVAVTTDKLPTITDLVTRVPRLIRLALLVGAFGWALEHFEII